MQDSYYTISSVGESYINEKRSKFYGFAHHIDTIEQALSIVEDYKKKFYDARHTCWSYRLGKTGEVYRVNDDGEPSGTAGKPILGQIISADISDVIVISIRYFGGIKLGTSGLIEAYRSSAKQAIEAVEKLEVIEYSRYKIKFGYNIMGEIMRVIKDVSADILLQDFRENCLLKVKIRESHSNNLISRIEQIYGCEITEDRN